MKKIILITLVLFITNNIFAYNFPIKNLLHLSTTNKTGIFYTSSDDDFLIFSWTTKESYNSNIRFSMFLNMGLRYNYNITKHAAIYTGLTLKNVGMNQTLHDSANNKYTFIARNYFIGIPLGLRLGNLNKGSELSFGTGLDFTLHHKEKIWEQGNKHSTKRKINQQWFDNTYSPFVNPYVFVSYKYRGIGVKFQHYINPFLKNNVGYGNLNYISLLLNSKSSSEKNTNNKTKKVQQTLKTI